jgi:hypothetical protein
MILRKVQIVAGYTAIQIWMHVRIYPDIIPRIILAKLRFFHMERLGWGKRTFR